MSNKEKRFCRIDMVGSFSDEFSAEDLKELMGNSYPIDIGVKFNDIFPREQQQSDVERSKPAQLPREASLEDLNDLINGIPVSVFDFEK